MLHHVSIGVSDFVRATRFYDETLAPLGYKRVMMFAPKAAAYGIDTPIFWVQAPDGQASAGNGAHIAFAAKSHDAVNKFHAAALRMGGTDNGAPGPRPNYTPDYYGGFVIDPDGNKIEAVFMTGRRAAAKARSKRKKAKPARKAKATPKRATSARRKPAGRKAASPRRGRPRAR